MDRSKFSFRQVVYAVIAVIAFMLMADFNSRWNEKQRLALQYEQAVEQREALLATQAVLEKQIEYASSDMAVEAWAYSQGGMSRPGDVVIVPLPAPGEYPTPTPKPQVEAQERSNWDIWWSLFFDSEEPAP